MVNLKLLNKKNELIISVNYDKEVTKINPNCDFEDSLSDFNVSELGKELKIEEDQDIKNIFVNLVKDKGISLNYIASNEAIEEFKENKNINSFIKKIEASKIILNSEKIDLHPLIKFDMFPINGACLFANKKNIRFLIDNGFTLRTNNILLNDIYTDFSNLRENGIFLNIDNKEKKRASFSKISDRQLDLINGISTLEMLNNFVKYTEKRFGFEWNEERIKVMYAIISGIYYYDLNKGQMNSIYQDFFISKKFSSINFLSNLKAAMKSIGFESPTHVFEIQKINNNNYLSNFVEKPLFELFKSFKFEERFDLSKVLLNKDLYNMDFDNKIESLDGCLARTELSLINRLIKEDGFVLKSYDGLFNEKTIKNMEEKLLKYYEYFIMVYDKNKDTGKEQKSIYLQQSYKDLIYENKYSFLKKEIIENYLNEKKEISKDIIDNNIEELENKVLNNVKTLEDFVKEYKIDTNSQQYKDLINIFNEKQEELNNKIKLEEKNQKSLFEKIKSKTEILLFGGELK